MDSVISAIIGGLFSLAGIILKHYLDTRASRRTVVQRRHVDDVPARNPAAAQPPAVTEKSKPEFEAAEIRPAASRWRRVRTGLIILFFDAVLITIVVNAFDLNHTDPWWEGIFAFIVVGAIPVYALYLIVTGAVGGLRTRPST